MSNKNYYILILFTILLFIVATGEVLADASAQTVTAVNPVKNPVGWWKFDGSAKDRAGKNHGLESGDPTYENGVFGKAISFDGKDDFIVVTDNGGRRYDNETGHYYYRARYYSYYLGRFLQTDPISYAGGLNLYAYCGNNPLNWIDP